MNKQDLAKQLVVIAEGLLKEGSGSEGNLEMIVMNTAEAMAEAFMESIQTYISQPRRRGPGHARGPEPLQSKMHDMLEPFLLPIIKEQMAEYGMLGPDEGEGE